MRRFSFAVGVFVALAGLTTAYGQNRLPSGSGFGGSTSAPVSGGSAAGGSQGMFGARSLGSSLSAGNRGFAGGGGGQGAGGGGRGGVAGQTLQGDTAGQLTGNERFLRDARQAGQFVGADPNDAPVGMTQVLNGQGRTNTGLNSRNNRGQNQANVNDGNNNRGGGRGRTGSQPMLRTTRVVGFDYPAPNTATITAEFPQRVAKIPQFRGLPPIQVEVRNRTAILRGEVATAHDRDLIERLALLEAGISQVQNELTVASTPSAAGSDQFQPTAE